MSLQNSEDVTVMMSQGILFLATQVALNSTPFSDLATRSLGRVLNYRSIEACELVRRIKAKEH